MMSDEDAFTRIVNGLHLKTFRRLADPYGHTATAASPALLCF
jgi:hypothetical protein